MYKQFGDEFSLLVEVIQSSSGALLSSKSQQTGKSGVVVASKFSVQGSVEITPQAELNSKGPAQEL